MHSLLLSSYRSKHSFAWLCFFFQLTVCIFPFFLCTTHPLNENLLGHQKGEDLDLALGLGDPATDVLGPDPGTGAGTHLGLDLKKDEIEKKRGNGDKKASLR